MHFDYEKKFEHEGLQFRMRVIRDESMGLPWKEHDGHGIVSDWTDRDPEPGELVLSTDRHSHRYYDVDATIQLARKDGWGVKDSEGKTKEQILTEAVQSDYERLKAWCDDEWWWVLVRVDLLAFPQGETMPGSDGWTVIPNDDCWKTLGGIESDEQDYHMEVAKDLASEIAASFEGKDVVCFQIRKVTA